MNIAIWQFMKKVCAVCVYIYVCVCVCVRVCMCVYVCYGKDLVIIVGWLLLGGADSHEEGEGQKN